MKRVVPSTNSYWISHVNVNKRTNYTFYIKELFYFVEVFMFINLTEAFIKSDINYLDLLLIIIYNNLLNIGLMHFITVAAVL